MKVNPVVRQLAMEHYHPPDPDGPSDWMEHGVLAVTKPDFGLVEGNWLACFTPDPDNNALWHITGGSLPFRGDKLRRTARPIGSMTMSRCGLYSEAHPATRLDIRIGFAGRFAEKGSYIAAVGYGILTAAALRQGHSTLCVEGNPWSCDERRMAELFINYGCKDGDWFPDGTTDTVLHNLGYRVDTRFPAGYAAIDHVTLRRDDLMRVPLNKSQSRLAVGMERYIEDGVACIGVELHPRSNWLPAEALAG